MRGPVNVAYGVLAAVDAALAGKASRTARAWRRFTKPLLMPVLGSGFAVATAHRDDRLRKATLAAQALSWGGDVALLRSGERAFLTGLGSFLAAHVAYIAGLAAAGSADPAERRSASGMRAAAGPWLGLAPTMATVAGRRHPGLRLPVAGYATALAEMLAAATTLDQRLPVTGRSRIAAGSALFVLSDGMLGLREFVLEGEHPRLESLVMATYTAAQWMIADGVSRLEPA